MTNGFPDFDSETGNVIPKGFHNREGNKTQNHIEVARRMYKIPANMLHTDDVSLLRFIRLRSLIRISICLLFVMDTCCLLETFPAQFSFL